MHTPIIRVIAQKHGSDCSVACLAMLIGVSYEEALVAMAAAEPNVLTKGVWTKHIVQAAHRLGYRLTRRRRFDLEADTGLLNLSSRRWLAEHIVVLREGLVIDTDGSVWDAADYLGAQKAKPGTLLVAEAL